MAYELKYDVRFNGAKATSLKGAQIVSSVLDGGTWYDLTSGVSTTCTGYYYEGYGSMIYPQTTDGLYLIVDLSAPDFQFTEGTGKYSYSQPSAQRYVNTIIKNNAHILQNNLVCARFYSKLSKQQQKQLYDLQARMERRNKSLLNDGMVTEVETASPAGFADLEAQLQDFMQDYQSGSIGLVLSTTAVIVISCVVVASLATAAYFAYKALAAESDKDVRYSDELTRTLMTKLTSEEYEQLMQETRGIVTKSKLRSLVSGSTTTLRLVALAAAGVAAYYFIKKRQ